MLSFEEARKRVLSLAPRLCAERVGLDEACGRVLAAPVTARADMPAFDYSAMDGYAVEVAGWPGGAPWRLPLVGESRAGGAPLSIAPGTACRIFTGAPLPRGADAVVMQENAEREGDSVVFRERPSAGAHVRRRGEDLGRGATAIEAGTRLRPSHIGLAAACDHAWLDVTRRPMVTILGTGDELRPPGSAGAGGDGAPVTIPESNGHALHAMATRAGARARHLPSAPDERDAMTRTFAAALRGTDALVTIGGVSVGNHDLVRPVLEELGARIDFWKVAIKPGKPLLVGSLGETVILGLPGNPASAMITFALFGVPLLRAMQGDARPLPVPLRARLARDLAHQPGRLEFVRVTLHREGDSLIATPTSNQASGASTSMAAADALVCIEAEGRALKAGDSAEILLLDDLCA